MPVLQHNPALWKTAAAGGDSDYQIPKCLRFEAGDSSFLKRSTVLGNRRTWTFSTWFKKTAQLGENQVIFAQGASNEDIQIRYGGGSDTITVQGVIGGAADISEVTSRVFRDPSAWHHLVVTCDTNHDEPSDRLRIYINGKRLFPSGASSCSQYAQTGVNDGNPIYLACNRSGASFTSGYLADTYLLDGLAVSPSSFGSWDSLGVWNPRSFRRYSPNVGTDYTTKGTATGTWSNASGSGGVSQIFDGDTSTLAYASGGADTFATFTFDTPIKFSDLRLYVGEHGTADTQILINDVDLKGDFAWAVAGSWKTVTSKVAGNELKKIALKDKGGASSNFRAIEVDGRILKDSTTDITTRNNPNNGTTWSGGTAAGTIHGAWANLFDGGVAPAGPEASSGNSGAYAELTLPAPIEIKGELRLLSWIDNPGCKLELTIDGSTADYANLFDAPPTASQWRTVRTTAGSLTKIKLTSYESGGSNHRARLVAMEVDGHIITDSTADNSFHLKFNDTSSNDALGKTSIQKGEIASANGAHPILNTSDDLGQEVSSGNRTDSNSGNLELALPFNNSTSDVSSNSIGMTNSGSTNTTSNTKFYGNARDFDGSNDSIYNTSASSDLDWNSNSSVCYEWWAKSDDTTQTATFLVLGETAVQSHYQGFAIKMENGGFESFVSSNNSSWNVVGNTPVFSGTPDTKWHHYAWTYDASADKIRTFQDGKLVETVNNVTAGPSVTEATLNIGGGSEGNNVAASYFNGQVSDFRFYKGTAKYTTDFIVPKPNDFTVNNLIAATTGTTDHAADITATSAARDGYPFNRIFNGNDEQHGAITVTHGNSFHITFTPSTAIACTSSLKVKHYARSGVIDTLNIAVNDGSDIDVSNNASTAISDVFSGVTGNQITKIKLHGTYDGTNAGGEVPGIYYIEVDGDKLIYIGGEFVDSFTDTPTNYGTDEQVGGEVRGNYATLNPLDAGSYVTLTQGNLYATQSAQRNDIVKSTIGMSSGKWYAEFTCDGENSSLTVPRVGLSAQSDAVQDDDFGNTTTEYAFSIGTASSGKVRNNSSWDGSGTTFAVGDIGCVAFDADTGKMWFGKNGTWLESGNPATAANPWFTATMTNNTYFWTVMTGHADGKVTVNFGQRAWKYTCPSGFKALCTQSLSDTFDGEEAGIVNNPSKYFDVLTYTGNDGSVTLTPEFSPDLVALKSTDTGWQWNWFDRIRGDDKSLCPQNQNAQTTATDQFTFNTSSVTVDEGGNEMNNQDDEYLTYHWDAGSAATTVNTTGDIDPSESWVNTTAGFNMLKYTGTGSAGTIGHNLSAVPDFWIIKNYDDNLREWLAYTQKIDGSLDYFYFHGNEQKADSSVSAPTDSVFSVSSTYSENTKNFIAYLWTEIPGFSKFGCYDANGLDDGPFIYCGFRPELLIIKATNVAGENWYSFGEGQGETYNERDQRMAMNTNATSSSYAGNKHDMLSNGFKIRENYVETNSTASGSKYLYMAWAKHPFKTGRAH